MWYDSSIGRVELDRVLGFYPSQTVDNNRENDNQSRYLGGEGKKDKAIITSPHLLNLRCISFEDCHKTGHGENQQLHWRMTHRSQEQIEEFQGI